MAEFWICKSYAGWEYAWIYLEYASYKTQCEVTLQVNEHLLRDSEPGQRSKMEFFEKIIIVFNYFCTKTPS